MIDFDRACVGPYMWDLIRLMVSVTLKRDTEEETSGTFLRPGVALSLRRGYEWGILNTDQAPVQMQRAEPFLPPGVIASNEVEDQEAASAQFFQKRLAEMRQFAVDPSNLEVRTLAHSYLKAIGKEDEQDGFEIVEAGQLKNWNGRVRTLILLRQELKGGGVLIDIKPVFRDPDNEFFVNPYAPDHGRRMMEALRLYAPEYVKNACLLDCNDDQYFAHEVPTFKVGIRRPLREEDQRDLLYAVGTQLGRGHGLSTHGGGHSVSHILFHLNVHWADILATSERLKDELTSAYRRYITTPPNTK